MSVYDRVAISLMSAPAANTFSPPWTTTARTSARPRISPHSANSSSCTWAFSAFIGGRSRRIVPIPPSTSSVRKSATCASLSGRRRESRSCHRPDCPTSLQPSASPPTRTAARTSRSTPGTRTVSSSASSTRPTARRERAPGPAHRAGPRHLVRAGGRGRRRSALRLPGRGSVAARGGPAPQPGQAAAGPLRPSGRGGRRLAAGGLRSHRGCGPARRRELSRRSRLRGVRASRSGRPRTWTGVGTCGPRCDGATRSSTKPTSKA